MAKLRIRLGEQEWTTDASLGQLLNVEVMAIERATGMALNEFTQALQRGSLTSITALIWVLRRRQEPGLELDAVSFVLDDLDTEVIDDDPAAEGKGEASETAGDST